MLTGLIVIGMGGLCVFGFVYGMHKMFRWAERYDAKGTGE